MSVRIAVDGREVSNRWPHIRRFLRVESANWVEDNFHWWWNLEDTLSPTERAAALEEWAAFYEWRLTQRADELAMDRGMRHLVERWTDEMTYCCRRSAAWARGEDPGAWVPLWERRPDLDAEGRAIVAEIIAELDVHRQPAWHLRKVG